MKRSELRADPEKVAAFVQRGMEKTQLKRSEPLKRSGKGKHYPRTSQAGRAAVRARSGGMCIMCLWRGGHANRIVHLHHLLEKRNWPQYAQLPLENQVGVCEGCHDEHERAHVRIPWLALPLDCRACGCALSRRPTAGRIEP